jgi:hypothetical protein
MWYENAEQHRMGHFCGRKNRGKGKVFALS